MKFPGSKAIQSEPIFQLVAFNTEGSALQASRKQQASLQNFRSALNDRRDALAVQLAFRESVICFHLLIVPQHDRQVRLLCNPAFRRTGDAVEDGQRDVFDFVFSSQLDQRLLVRLRIIG